MAQARGEATRHHNDVHLIGRLAAPAVARVLPSGDPLVSWRLVVERPPESRRRPGAVDTIDCASWRAGVRRAVQPWVAGDLIEVTGALRRRFFRTPAGAVSRYEVDAVAVRRIIRRPAR